MYPPFAIGKDRYDQNTFMGRLKHFINLVEPSKLLVTQKDVEYAQNLIEKFKSNPEIAKDPGLNKQLWYSKELINAVVHPDTKQKLFPLFSWAGFVPMNVPITLGMVFIAKTTPQILFWQWYNQTYNVCLNYANRNASNVQSNTQIIGAYIGAVSISCGLAFTLNKFVKKMTFTSVLQKNIINILVPTAAVCAAGVSNVLIMRYNEGIDGVKVLDQNNDDYGRSVNAGRQGLTYAAASRFVLPLPCLLITPLIIRLLESTRFYPKGNVGKETANIIFIILGLYAAAPLSLALFPQNIQIHKTNLEPKFQNLVDKTGKPIEWFYYNKGL